MTTDVTGQGIDTSTADASTWSISIGTLFRSWFAGAITATPFAVGIGLAHYLPLKPAVYVASLGSLAAFAVAGHQAGRGWRSAAAPADRPYRGTNSRRTRRTTLVAETIILAMVTWEALCGLFHAIGWHGWDALVMAGAADTAMVAGPFLCCRTPGLAPRWCSTARRASGPISLILGATLLAATTAALVNWRRFGARHVEHDPGLWAWLVAGVVVAGVTVLPWLGWASDGSRALAPPPASGSGPKPLRYKADIVVAIAGLLPTTTLMLAGVLVFSRAPADTSLASLALGAFDFGTVFSGTWGKPVTIILAGVVAAATVVRAADNGSVWR